MKSKIRWNEFRHQIFENKLRTKIQISYRRGTVDIYYEGRSVGYVNFSQAGKTVSGNPVFYTTSNLHSDYHGLGWGLLMYLLAIEAFTNKFPNAYINSEKIVACGSTSDKAAKIWRIIANSNIVKRRNLKVLYEYSSPRNIVGFRYSGQPILGSIIKRYRKKRKR